MKEAAFVNAITTVAKLVPILVFILVAIVAFNFDLFLSAFRNMGAGLGEEARGSAACSTR